MFSHVSITLRQARNGKPCKEPTRVLNSWYWNWKERWNVRAEGSSSLHWCSTIPPPYRCRPANPPSCLMGHRERNHNGTKSGMEALKTCETPYNQPLQWDSLKAPILPLMCIKIMGNPIIPTLISQEPSETQVTTILALRMSGRLWISLIPQLILLFNKGLKEVFESYDPGDVMAYKLRCNCHQSKKKRFPNWERSQCRILGIRQSINI